MKLIPPLLFASLLSIAAFAGETEAKKAVTPPEPDRWKFLLAIPGWMPGMKGDTGINGFNSQVDLTPGDIIRHYDFALSLRGEASKGRFGIMGDLLYTSLSDGIGTNTVVKKVDLQVDQTIAELALRWRVLETPRWSVDVTGGVRYLNLFQKVALQSNDPQIDAAADQIATAGIRARLVIARELAALAGRNPTLPIGPLNGNQIDALTRFASRLQGTREERSAAIAQRLRQITSNETSRTDAWWDPVIGLRARYNFNDKFYVTARGDIGGFSIGSQLTWQLEGALGCQLTPHIFAEVGYRALSIDYDSNGLLYDVIMQGAQVTMGIAF
jgi:hypothetical protein